MYFLDEAQIYVFEQPCVKDGLDSKIISVPICGLFVVTILEVYRAICLPSERKYLPLLLVKVRFPH